MKITISPLVFCFLSFFLLTNHDSIDHLALTKLMCIEVFGFALNLQLYFKSFTFQSFLMSQTLSEMMPTEFRKILQIPQIFRVKISLFSYHFLTIESQSCHFSHPLISKLYPTFSETNLLIASSFNTILSSPFAFRKKIDSLYIIAAQQFTNVVWLHVRWNARQVANSSIILHFTILNSPRFFSIKLSLAILLFFILIQLSFIDIFFLFSSFCIFKLLLRIFLISHNFFLLIIDLPIVLYFPFALFFHKVETICQSKIKTTNNFFQLNQKLVVVPISKNILDRIKIRIIQNIFITIPVLATQEFQIIQLLMKRKPSQELVGLQQREFRRLKSPNSKKTIKKDTDQHQLIFPRQRPIKSKDQTKPDSNNSTATTRPRSNKQIRRKDKPITQGLNQLEIMTLINSFATKIQRQWRVYLFRKRLRSLVQSRKKMIKPQVLRFDIPQFSSANSLYDREKYESLSSIRQGRGSDRSKKSKGKKSCVSNSSSQILSQRNLKSKSQLRSPREIQMIPQMLSRSLEKPISSGSLEQEFGQRRSSLNALDERHIQNRRHSTGQLGSFPQKQLQIGRAYEIRVQSIPSTKMPERKDSEAAIAFRKGSSIQRLVRGCKKELQRAKLKQLLSLQNRYSKNQVTYRSYIELVGNINHQHITALQQISQKEGQLQTTLTQLLELYKSNRTHPQFAEDQLSPRSHHAHSHLSSSHLDISLSLDKWDFNSSAKKGGQFSQQQIPSIESVLQELEEEDAEDKKFRKNKSRQIIEAIAERSKQISEKDVASFDQIKSDQIIKESLDQKQFETPPDKKEIETQDFTGNKAVISFEPIMRVQQLVGDKVETEVGNEQSWQVSPSVQALFISQGTIQSPKIQQRVVPAPIQNRQDPLLYRFRQLALELLLLDSIKLINSLKFACARAAKQKNQSKLRMQQLAARINWPAIPATIDFVNDWLLQVSHFMLDSYQGLIRDNLLTVRQPPLKEILRMAQQETYWMPLYETVPEFVFKDFEFFFIKSLAKKNGVNDQDYEHFSTLTYTFHRALVDALNTALMVELPHGTQWIRTPWTKPTQGRVPRNRSQHAKLCLERSINVVSNWAEYGLGRSGDGEWGEEEWRAFQQEKIGLVVRQQVLEGRLNPSFSEGAVLLQLCSWQLQREIELAVVQLLAMGA